MFLFRPSDGAGFTPLHRFLCISECAKQWFLCRSHLCKQEHLVYFLHLPGSRAQQFSPSSKGKSAPARYY